MGYTHPSDGACILAAAARAHCGHAPANRLGTCVEDKFCKETLPPRCFQQILQDTEKRRAQFHISLGLICKKLRNTAMVDADYGWPDSRRFGARYGLGFWGKERGRWGESILYLTCGGRWREWTYSWPEKRRRHTGFLASKPGGGPEFAGGRRRAESRVEKKEAQAAGGRRT